MQILTAISVYNTVPTFTHNLRWGGGGFDETSMECLIKLLRAKNEDFKLIELMRFIFV